MDIFDCFLVATSNIEALVIFLSMFAYQIYLYDGGIWENTNRLIKATLQVCGSFHISLDVLEFRRQHIDHTVPTSSQF